MNRADAIAMAIEKTRLIAIVRTDDGETASMTVDALAVLGVHVAEISLTTPDAFMALERLASRRSDPLHVGAGTVRSVEDARRAADAGATFLVSPGLDVDVLDWATQNDLLYIPGAFSPTEVAAGLGRGARFVKLFPAGRLGSGYVRDLLAPFPEARLVPTGGITADNIQGFLHAGACAVAVGSALINPETIRDISRLAAVVRQLQSLVAS